MNDIYTKLKIDKELSIRKTWINFKDGRSWAVTCHICKTWTGFSASPSNIGELHIDHTIKFDGYYYIIHDLHTECKKLFELNPLAYEISE